MPEAVATADVSFWWEVMKVMPGIVGAATGGLALYLGRRDARRAAQALKPTAHIQLNPEPEQPGFYLMKLTFFNVREAFAVKSVSVIKPRDIVLVGRTKAPPGFQPPYGINFDIMGQKITVIWEVARPKDIGEPAAFAHVYIKAKELPSVVVLKLEGHLKSGMQEPIVIQALGRR